MIGDGKKETAMDQKRQDSSTGKVCAYCEGPAEGNFTIHRDGMGVGPELQLCDEHGRHPTPTCEEIWERIRERRGEVSGR